MIELPSSLSSRWTEQCSHETHDSLGQLGNTAWMSRDGLHRYLLARR